MKPATQKIIGLWFSPDSNEARKAAKENPEIWNACITAKATFSAPSGATHEKYYTVNDRAAFAKAVQKILK